MKRRSVLSLFWQYLVDGRRSILLFFLMAAAYLVVVRLYGYHSETVYYAALLSGCVGLLGGALSFSRYVRKHRELVALRESVLFGAFSAENLPEPDSLLDEDYRELLRLQEEETRRRLNACDKTAADMADYYTLWAHQIKTPIAAMKLLLQSGEERGEALSAELFKVEQYVEMVLAYMRLSSDTTDYVLKRYALDPIVRKAIRKYARLFILKNISVEYTPTDLHVVTDEKWLSFVIEQLLSNAVKYTPAGSVSVYAEGERLFLRDTGIGIPEGDLPRIYEKGYTGRNGRIENRSTGLGLYLSKRTLSRLSHTIRIESRVGEGTTVCLGFPSKPETDE